MEELIITPEILQNHNISPDEFQAIKTILKREPTWEELGIFSVMWSEHASYKNSIRLLKTLPRESDCLLAKPGEENAGVVDIGDGLAISFKIESHNHPSALEPYHGAATGVGGILRDIFTMGARPIAVLDSLCFGNPNDSQVQHLIKGVVSGIADYGNCFGVPTVGGETCFEDCYGGNPLINAMAVGVLRHEHLAKSGASGPGNHVVYVGAKTGRDGIHGATFASVELSSDSEENRTAVQVGDPFMEKLLLESTLEAIQNGLVVAIQDMGAAGLTCSSSEMAGKTGVGIEIDVALVPQRESGMSPYEIMLSESQERMLIITKPADFENLQRIFLKWGLEAVIIGSVCDDGFLTVKNSGQVVARIPAVALVLGGQAPVYTREISFPEDLKKAREVEMSGFPEISDYSNVLCQLLQSPNIVSKRSIYRHYDHMVKIATLVEPGSDAAVLKINGSDKAVALSTDCNSRYCWLDPYEGSMGAVAEAARNVACTGAKPLAITNCLNFGNPYKSDVYWYFSEAIRGMSDACRFFGIPVTGGNVSFYNESPAGAVFPTPVIGMLGLLTDYDRAINHYFKQIGDAIYLLGPDSTEIGGSEFLKIIHKKICGYPPKVHLEQEVALHGLMTDLCGKGIIQSAHDCSEGGMLVNLAECCFAPDGKNLGVIIDYHPKDRKDIAYFGETHGRIIISLKPEFGQELQSLALSMSIMCRHLGYVAGNDFIVNDDVRVSVSYLRKLWEGKDFA